MKKLLLSAAFAVAAAGCFSASAVTAKDLVGKKCGVLANGTNIGWQVAHGHLCSDVVAGSSSNQIIIKNFLGFCDLPMTLNESTGKLSVTLGTFKGTGNFAGKTIYFKKRNFSAAGFAIIDGGNDYYYGEVYNLATGTVTSSKADESSDAFDYGFTITHGDSQGVLGFCIGVDGANQFQYFGSFDFLFFDTNATATQYTNSGTSKYDVHLAADLSEGIFRIDNLFNFGMMYKNTLVPKDGYGETNPVVVYGNLDFANNKITIPATEVGGGIKGIVNYNGSITYLPTLDSYYERTRSGYWEFDYDTTSDYHYLTSAYNTSTKVLSDVTGSFELKDPAHRKGENFWVTNGGTTTTHMPIDMTLDKAGYYELYANKFTTFANKIVISGETEVTLDTDLNINTFGVSTSAQYNNQGDIHVAGTITINKNDMNVDHYELCMVPGSFSNVTSGFAHHDEKGHELATNISDSKFDVLTSRAVSSDMAGGKATYSFDKYIPKADIENAASDHKSYSFFIKAVYKPETNLAPTFHSLQAPGVTTGIEDIENGSSNVTISTAAGTISVAGAEGAEVEVYTAAGVQVYAGTDSEIAVEAGLYIVKVGSKVQKVVVR